REKLLAVKGIGPETADSITLYAAGKPVFVVDAYTYRILLRHDLIADDAGYEEIQDLFLGKLPTETQLFNEYHALLVRLAKEYCKKSNPLCDACPLQGL
ncbi:MAG: endonuclease III domain-containing protein, partial [Proteobacteria bacterium]|nr:endonuclease III domain-containing protein [Pseudomonadota bacterium]